jgi:hypothetical protein
MFRGSPPHNVKAEIHVSPKKASATAAPLQLKSPKKHLSGHRQHYFAPLLVASSAEFVCPLPLCSAFAYNRLCDTFILLGVLSRIWNINLNAFSQKGSDVSELPFKPRFETPDVRGKTGHCLSLSPHQPPPFLISVEARSRKYRVYLCQNFSGVHFATLTLFVETDGTKFRSWNIGVLV